MSAVKTEFKEKICTKCNESFETRNDSDFCYRCHLEKICGPNPPEEGDFYTATIRSGTYSDKWYKEAQKDLRAVETGISRPLLEPEYPDDYIAWEEPPLCHQCGMDVSYCQCTCALCDNPVEGGGLCEEHKPNWIKELSGSSETELLDKFHELALDAENLNDDLDSPSTEAGLYMSALMEEINKLLD
jgi:hypothetical protein